LKSEKKRKIRILEHWCRTIDKVETCLLHDCDQRCVLPGTCVWETDPRHVSLDWSEIMGNYNTADTVLKDRRKRMGHYKS